MAGLTKLRKQIPKDTRRVETIDLAEVLGTPPAGSDYKIKFRQPDAADMMPDGARVVQLNLSHPKFSSRMIGEILIMASCYVASKEDESGVDIDELMASIAEDNRDVFLYLLAQFGKLFGIASFEKRAADEGNASAQSSDG